MLVDDAIPKKDPNVRLRSMKAQYIIDGITDWKNSESLQFRPPVISTDSLNWIGSNLSYISALRNTVLNPCCGDSKFRCP